MDRTLSAYQAGREYVIMVPLADNEGRPFAPETIGSVEDRLVQVSGGYTAYPECRGVWSDSGHLYVDAMRPYAVATSDDGALSLARYVGGVMAQQAVYVRCPDGSAAIVPMGVESEAV